MFGKSRIHNIHDPVDGQRSFGNVGTHNDFATRWPTCKISARNKKSMLECDAKLGLNHTEHALYRQCVEAGQTQKCVVGLSE